jgi:hypothetical protein
MTSAYEIRLTNGNTLAARNVVHVGPWITADVLRFTTSLHDGEDLPVRRLRDIVPRRYPASAIRYVQQIGGVA